GYESQTERRPMAASASRGPLDPPPDGREAALAARWRRLRPGLPSALYLLACAVVLAVALVAVGWVLAKVVHDAGIGRADAGVDRWLAGERTGELNEVTVYTSESGGTLAITALAVVAVALAALAWRRWRGAGRVGGAGGRGGGGRPRVAAVAGADAGGGGGGR